MTIYRNLNDRRLKVKPRAIAIGVFDGVHRGHQKILRSILGGALTSLVITFDPHPNKVLKPKHFHPILMSLEHRLRLFDWLGVAEALVIKFDRKFSRISHEQFLRDHLIESLGMKSLTVSNDFCFGYRGLGNTRYLHDRSRQLGFNLSIVEPCRFDGEVISSTSIRGLIESGNLKKAKRMLGRNVSIYGTVIRGRGRGKVLSFPTANINPHHETLPPNGVYAVRGLVGRQELRGVLHIGPRPTFAEKEKTVEVHFFNFNEVIYGCEIELFFEKYLRPITLFENSNALIQAIHHDIEMAEKAFQ